MISTWALSLITNTKHRAFKVSGIKFLADAPYRKLKISNKMSTQAKKELEKKAKGKSAAGGGGSSSRPHRGATPPPAISRSTSS
jgi:hypothetical protein